MGLGRDVKVGGWGEDGVRWGEGSGGWDELKMGNWVGWESCGLGEWERGMKNQERIDMRSGVEENGDVEKVNIWRV